MANTVYANEVLANKLTDILTTKVDLQGYMTVDTSLTENAGMKKVINTYTASGNVEDLDMGEGNTGDITACRDRKSTRLNSSHVSISYAVFCLKKKNN